MTLELHAVAKGETEKGEKIEPGMIVGYLGHVLGGNVAIRFQNGKEDVAHPHCFRELR